MVVKRYLKAKEPIEVYKVLKFKNGKWMSVYKEDPIKFGEIKNCDNFFDDDVFLGDRNIGYHSFTKKEDAVKLAELIAKVSHSTVTPKLCVCRAYIPSGTVYDSGQTLIEGDEWADSYASEKILYSDILAEYKTERNDDF